LRIPGVMDLITVSDVTERLDALLAVTNGDAAQ
jgi:hypothetical protein